MDFKARDGENSPASQDVKVAATEKAFQYGEPVKQELQGICNRIASFLPLCHWFKPVQMGN